jgi:hypothetical protein
MFACRHAQSGDRDAGRLRTTARASGLYRLKSINRIAFVLPTIETADQLLYAKAELNHIQRPFRRAITTNPITVRDDQSPPVEVSRRRSAHCSMGDIHSAGNVASPVDLRRSCVYKNNPVSSPKSLIQVPWVDFVLKLRLVIPNLVVHRYLLSRSASVTRRNITQSKRVVSAHPVGNESRRNVQTDLYAQETHRVSGPTSYYLDPHNSYASSLL